MEFREYQERAAETAHYPGRKTRPAGISYVGLGLAGESGEVANNVKKIARDDGNFLTNERREKIMDEAGDALWYIAMLCDEIHASMETIAAGNLEKLRHRHGEKGGSLRED